MTPFGTDASNPLEPLELEPGFKFEPLPVPPMSRRDWFAAAALQGMLAGLLHLDDDFDMARAARQYADALIDELNNNPPTK